MVTWTTRHLYEQAQKSLPEPEARNLTDYAQSLLDKNLAVIFSIGHLGHITKTGNSFLQDSILRKREHLNYKIFTISKRSGGKRFIHAPAKKILKIQQYINRYILQNVEPHTCSYAYNSKVDFNNIKECAQKHCEKKWIFSFDLKDFFYSINEIHVFDIFLSLGYTKYVAFTLSRLCTTTKLPSAKIEYLKRNCKYFEIGVLPQGSPASPMLSNLVLMPMDRALSRYANENGLSYTRYADDLTFSANYLPADKSISRICNNITTIVSNNDLTINKEKTRISGPGTRKRVLGLLVDQASPRISKEMYKRIDSKLYAINRFGWEKVAIHDGFDSVFGLYNHLHGLMSFIKGIDRGKWEYFNIPFSQATKLFSIDE